MRNSDLPAMPIPNGADGAPWSISDMGNPGHVFGLTKREYFVARAMHGICGNPGAHTMAPDAIARRAMSVAKTVLAALEQEQAK